MVHLTDQQRSNLAERRRRLVDFARGSAHPDGGFAWLGDTGRSELDRPVEAWITCRMTHVFALAALQGDESVRPLLDHGVQALRGRLHDDESGGWFAAVDAGGPTESAKQAYPHAFVLIAAASATAAGHPAGQGLLDEAIAVFEQRFWREDDGMAVEEWDRSWGTLEDYRGVNANMHTTEAMLAVHDVKGDPVWLDRAARIVERVVHGFAREAGWHLPEHFDPDWQAQPDYNRDHPADAFRPYGVTIGHLLEWSRLTLNVRTALGDRAPAWMLDDARSLFDRAVTDGWAVDGADGFVYTTDFEGAPVVRERMHWVVAEGISAAWALATATGDDAYLQRYQQWWDYADTYLVDREHGSWHHELDPSNRPAATVWPGKPDVYHAYQTALLPELGEISSFVGALTHPTPRI